MRQCLNVCLYVCRFVYLYICLFGGAREESKMYDVIQRNGIYHTSITQQRNNATTQRRMNAWLRARSTHALVILCAPNMVTHPSSKFSTPTLFVYTKSSQNRGGFILFYLLTTSKIILNSICISSVLRLPRIPLRMTSLKCLLIQT